MWSERQRETAAPVLFPINAKLDISTAQHSVKELPGCAWTQGRCNNLTAEDRKYASEFSLMIDISVCLCADENECGVHEH